MCLQGQRHPIFMEPTASVMQQDRKLITEAGFNGYVGKPINIKEFLSAVRGALGEKDA